MACREAESADARKIGSVMGMMNGRGPFEDSGRLYHVAIQQWGREQVVCDSVAH